MSLGRLREGDRIDNPRARCDELTLGCRKGGPCSADIVYHQHAVGARSGIERSIQIDDSGCPREGILRRRNA